MSAENRSAGPSSRDTHVAANCPYCGEPKADHTYVSRTSCVIARPSRRLLDACEDDTADETDGIEVNDGFGI